MTAEISVSGLEKRVITEFFKNARVPLTNSFPTVVVKGMSFRLFQYMRVDLK